MSLNIASPEAEETFRKIGNFLYSRWCRVRRERDSVKLYSNLKNPFVCKNLDKHLCFLIINFDNINKQYFLSAQHIDKDIYRYIQASFILSMDANARLCDVSSTRVSEYLKNPWIFIDNVNPTHVRQRAIIQGTSVN